MKVIENVSERILIYFDSNSRYPVMRDEATNKKIININYFNCKTGFTSIVIYIFVLFNCLLFVFSVQYFNIIHVYGQTSEVTFSNQSDRMPNESGNSTSYGTLVENLYPIPVQQVSKILHGPAVIYGGTVILKNTSNDRFLLNKLTKGGSMVLQQHEVPHHNISFNLMKGNSSDGTSFGTDSLNYNGRYISLNFGKIVKYPKSNQISFNFYLQGEKGAYLLTLINGRAPPEGWINNTFYQHLPLPQTHSKLIDLAEIVSTVNDKYLYLDKIQINIEKGTLIDPLTFRIDLGKTTINTPGVINDNISFLIDGLIFKDKIMSTEYYYLFQDWRFKQILNQEFEIESDDDYIIESNGWKITNMNESKDPRTGKIILNLQSERYQDFNPLSILHILKHLNIYNSLMAIGSPQGVLFISIFLLMVLFFYPMSNWKGRMRGSKK